jgi:hypothetical protein
MRTAPEPIVIRNRNRPAAPSLYGVTAAAVAATGGAVGNET